VADEIRIERGAPTDEELAALVTVLLSRRSAAVAEAEPLVSRWARSARPRAVVRGAHAWRASALPR
jgi:hypothetical protein